MLTPDGYKSRIVDYQIDELMKIYGAVCVEGLKWSGKTWTSRNHAVSASFISDPANNFMNQEPGTNEDIKEFCDSKYGVTFPMMAKISVKGDDMHPLYRWLTSKNANGVLDSEVSWNFQKYLIDENGNLVGFLKPAVKPLSDEVVHWVTKGQFAQAK